LPFAVDMFGIDQKALALDKASSEACLLIAQPNGQQKIKGIINEVYFLPRGDHWTIRGGSLSMISNEKDLVPSIGTDKTAAIASAKDEQKRINGELKVLRQDLARLDQQHTDLTRAWNNHRKNQKLNEKAIADLVSQIDELKMELECLDNVAVDTKIEEEEVAEAANEIEQVRAAEVKAKEELAGITPHIEDISGRLAETNQRNAQILHDMSETQGRLTTLLETQTQQQGMVDKYKQKLAQYDKLVEGHQEKIDKYNEERLKTLYKARILQRQWERMSEESEVILTMSQDPDDDELEKIEPMRVSKDAEYYKTKVARAQEKVEQERKRQKLNDEDPEEAHLKYIQAKENLGTPSFIMSLLAPICCFVSALTIPFFSSLASKTEKIANMDNHIAGLTKDVTKRTNLWQDFLTHLKDVTATQFDQMLRLNHFSGSLEFDDTQSKLDLIVQKGLNGEAKTRDAKGLSGGERSYTTMCLLIALGENLETPFRILDEFDVFLDPQNRKLVMSVLIHTAKQLLHRQFIFITYVIFGLGAESMSFSR
jgi:chromosome segregation ATPase